MRGGGALVIGVIAVAALAAAVDWGCAPTTASQGQRLASPADPEPDGGWAAYRPSRREYDVDPGRLAAGPPPTAPVFSLNHDSH